MAINKTILVDKCEVVSMGSTYTTNNWKVLQVRTATVIKKDGVELTRSFERYAMQCGNLDPSDNLVETDISGEPAEVQAICNAVWTTDIKTAWKAKLIADKIPE